jgi:hypothetical protein
VRIFSFSPNVPGPLGPSGLIEGFTEGFGERLRFCNYAVGRRGEAWLGDGDACWGSGLGAGAGPLRALFDPGRGGPLEAGMVAT